MDTHLYHDPRTKQQIKEVLYSFLYSPIQKQFKTRLDTLIIRNTLLGRYGHKSFTYKGEHYSCDTTPAPRKANRLVKELLVTMEEYLNDVRNINDTEMPYVIGYINQVLNASNDLPDYLRLLPAALHRPVEEVMSTCPCRTKRLTDDEVFSIQEKNKHCIDLIKQRMVINLII
jgi:hypothetical protein